MNYKSSNICRFQGIVSSRDWRSKHRCFFCIDSRNRECHFYRLLLLWTIDKLYPDRQCISSSQIELNLLLPCFGLSHCTCAYTETVDPAHRPSIPQVRQGSVRLNLREEEPPPPIFPSCCILILCCGLSRYYNSRDFHSIGIVASTSCCFY